MRRRDRVALIALAVVRASAAGPAYGAVAAADCPEGSGYAFETTVWPAASLDGWTEASCPKKPCMIGGSGQPVTLSGMSASMGGFQATMPWRMPVDLAMTVSAQAGSRLQLQLMTLHDTKNGGDAQVSIAGVDSHKLSPLVALSTGGTLKETVDWTASGRAAPGAAKSPFLDPTGPDLTGTAVVNWTLSLRDDHATFGFDAEKAALTLTKKGSLWILPTDNLLPMLLGSTVSKGTDGSPGPVAIVSSVTLSGCKVGSPYTAAAFLASQRIAKDDLGGSSTPPPGPSDPPPIAVSPSPSPAPSHRPVRVVVLDTNSSASRLSYRRIFFTLLLVLLCVSV